MPTFEATATHDQIPREGAAIQAVIDLIKTGECSLPRVSERSLLLAPVATEAALSLETVLLQADVARANLDRGLLTREDVDWLLSPDPVPRPATPRLPV